MIRKHNNKKVETPPKKYDFDAQKQYLDALEERIQKLRNEHEQLKQELEHLRSTINVLPVIETPTAPLPPSAPDPCATCPNRMQIYGQGIYVGDSACTWCQHYPWRITCDTRTSDYATPVTRYSNGELAQMEQAARNKSATNKTED